MRNLIPCIIIFSFWRMDMKDDFLYKYRGVDNEVFDRDI